MGSRPYARDGARAACASVIAAVREWRTYPKSPLENLFDIIDVCWRARVAPHSPEDCACTCLFAVVEPDGSGVIAQIGDGLVVNRDGNGIETLAMKGEGGFGNVTTGLGVTSQRSGWTKVDLAKHARSVVLCTDGVADDLIPDRLEKFVDWLIEDVRPEPPAKRWRILERALREWPTPKHIDDKTIAVLHVPGGDV